MNYEIWLFPFLIVLIWGANSSACSEPLSCEQCKPHQPIEQIFFNENLIDIFSPSADSVCAGQLVLVPWQNKWVFATVSFKENQHVTIHHCKSPESMTIPMAQIRTPRLAWQIFWQPKLSKYMMQHLIKQYLEKHPPLEKPQLVVKIVEQASKVLAIGDLHGVLPSLTTIFKKMSDKKYVTDDLQLFENHYSVCLGDCADRGEEGVETWSHLIQHKLTNENATLLRGNHEDLAMSQQFNSDKEWLKKIGNDNLREIRRILTNLFSSLPYALLLGFAHADATQKPRYRFLFFSHAGIAPTLNLHNPIRAAIAAHQKKYESPVSLHLPLDISPNQLAMLLWNDFVANNSVEEQPKTYVSDRLPSAAREYNSSAAREYIERVQSMDEQANYILDAIICGHRHVPCGIAQLNDMVIDDSHWAPLPTNKAHRIQPGEVYSCNAFHTYDPKSTANGSFSCFEPTEDGWQVTPH